MHITRLNVVRAVVFTAGILAPLVSRGQQKPIDQPTVAHLLTQLHADEWTARAGGYEQLRADPTALTRTNVRRALLNLLDREDQLIE